MDISESNKYSSGDLRRIEVKSKISNALALLRIGSMRADQTTPKSQSKKNYGVRIELKLVSMPDDQTEND